jgi:hypothetical protein
MGLSGNAAEVEEYEKDNAAALTRGAKDLQLVYLAVGREDNLVMSSIAPTRAMFERQGIKYIYNESGE